MAKVKKTKNDWVEIFDGVSVKGTKERFGLNWFGAVIYGCRIVAGKNGDFISWPAFKNKDGEYIKTAYVYAEKDSDDAKLLDGVVEYFA